MTLTEDPTTTLIQTAADLHHKGWEITLAPAGKKAPVIPGTTGETHPNRLSIADIGTHILDGYHTLGVVPPKGIIGIDVDDYTKTSGTRKQGGQAMRHLKQCAGPLPPTWRTTSRTDPKSGIWFYRLPNQLTGTSPEHWPTGLDDVEYIRYSHRWAITEPSTHTDTGNPYRWQGPNGDTTAPHTNNLPTLTPQHVQHLRGECGCPNAPKRTHTPHNTIDNPFRVARYTDPHDAVQHLLAALNETSSGSRYDTMRDVVGSLIARGIINDDDLHNDLRNAYIEAVWKDRGTNGRQLAANEYNRAAQGAINKGFHTTNQPDTPTTRTLNATPDRPLLQLRTLSQIADLPPPQWHIENLIPQNGLTVLYGPPGSYKSFLALSLALALDRHQPFLGHPTRTPTRPLYIAGEGHSGLSVRADAWHQHHQLDHTDTDLLIQNGAINLADYDHTAQLTEAINEHQIGFIIFDTLARCTLGVEENSASDMGLVIANIDRIRHATNASILLVHHSGKDPTAGARGSSAIKGAADAELSVTKGQLRVEKMKDGPEIDPTPFTMIEPDGFSVSVVPTATSRPDYTPEPTDEPSFGDDLNAIIQFLENETTPRSKSAIYAGVPGRNTRLGNRIALAVERGYLTAEPGARGTHLIGLPEWK